MDINLVVVVAFFGSYAGDQLWYFLGAKHGANCSRANRAGMMGDRALEHIRKHPDIWVLSFRFVYGLRTVMPGGDRLSGYPPGRYLLLNGIGARSGPPHWPLPRITSARCSKACSAASKSTSCGSSAPCWSGPVLWLRRFKNAPGQAGLCRRATAKSAEQAKPKTPKSQTDGRAVSAA
jgi:hypothetical protein